MDFNYTTETNLAMVPWPLCPKQQNLAQSDHAGLEFLFGHYFDNSKNLRHWVIHVWRSGKLASFVTRYFLSD